MNNSFIFTHWSFAPQFRALIALLTILVFASVVQGEELLATGFEGSTNLPAGWTEQILEGSRSWKIQTGSGDFDSWSGSVNYPANAHGGVHNATLYWYTKGNKTRLLSPVFDTTGHVNLELTFWHTQWATSGGQDTLKILYSADGGANWLEMAYYQNNITSWTQRTITLPVSGANSQIAFEGVANYGFGVCLDDISISGDVASGLPQITVVATDASASEASGDGGSWTISRSGVTSESLTVNFSMTGTATEANDYTLSDSGSVTFGPGDTSMVVTLTPVDDSAFGEPEETATLTLTPDASYQLLSPHQGSVTIVDDDQADINILIVGSIADGGDQFGGPSEPFVPTGVATELENILSMAGHGTVNIEVEERHATASDAFGSSYSYNLASWYHWPYPAGVEAATRWPKLRGDPYPGNPNGTKWDYVVLIGDPFTMENFPGHYAHGVQMIAEEVAKGSSTDHPVETILLMPWQAPDNTSSSVAHYKEVVYRAGRTGGYKVAPAALAWEADGSSIGGGHPSPRGAYICAASIYSRIWEQSASHSDYDYDDALADQVNSTVTTNVNEPNQYSGSKMNFQNPWLMLGDKRREVWYSEKGSSTESYYANTLRGVLPRAGVAYNDSLRDSYTGNNPGWTGDHVPIAWNHGREGGSKGYVINPAYWQLAFTYHFQLNSQPYADDAANDFCLARIYSHELAQANRIKSQSPTMRNAAWRLMWGQFHKKHPSIEPVRDTAWHVATPTESAVGAFMYTLYSGRCPVNPGDTGQHADARMIGYQTAWRLGTCSSRAPGFKVMPSSATAVSVTPGTTDTMSVQFLFPPRHDVRVAVSSSDPSAAIAGSQTLVFTPSNYNVPQTITIAGVEGITESAPFTIDFTTASDDPAYHGLTDSWAYTCERTNSGTSHIDNGTTPYSTPKNFPVTINLGAAGANESNTTLLGADNGNLVWSGGDVTYTPDADFIGPDGFAYASLNGGTLTTGYIHIDVIDGFPDGSVRVEVADSSAAEEGQATGTFEIIREGDTTAPLQVNFLVGGTATFGDDYSLSTLSPATIGAGQSSVTVTLTPVDDSVFGERIETASLTLAAGAGYTETGNPAIISIADNDNNAPTVYAGADQEVTLTDSTLWTPAMISTAAWYDASDINTITSIGDGVSQWDDKSGKGNHMKQGTSSNRPATGTRTINGLNVLDFDGSGDWMQADNNPFGTTINDAFVMMVVNRDGTDDRREGFIALNATNPDEWEVVTWAWDSPDAMFRFFSNGGDNARRAYLPDLQGQTSLFGFYDSPTDNVKQLWINAINEMQTTSRGATDASEGIQIAKGQETGTTLDGMISEVIVIDGRVSEDTRQKLEGYLAHKWGFATKLPEGHPYEDAAPGAPGVTVMLSDATASDVDPLDTVAVSWRVFSKDPLDAADPTIATETQLNTSVNFTEAGTYVLELTGDDGFDQSTHTVTILVNGPLPAVYAAWAEGSFVNDFTDTALTSNPDGDRYENIMEFAFGTDPTVNDEGPLAMDGSAYGAPVSQEGAGQMVEFYFLRRRDHGTSGSISYTVQFSSDLSGFTNNDNVANPMTEVMGTGFDGTDYQLMKVAYPAGNRFSQIQVEMVE